MLISFIFFLLAGTYQAAIHCLSFPRCAPIANRDFEFEFPENYALVEQQHLFSTEFGVFPVDDDGKIVGGSLGKFYRIKGPIYDTFGFLDPFGNQILYANNKPFTFGHSFTTIACGDSATNFQISEPDWIRVEIERLYDRSFPHFGEISSLAGDEKTEWEFEPGKLRIGSELGAKLVMRDFLGDADFWLVANKAVTSRKDYSMAVAIFAFKSLVYFFCVENVKRKKTQIFR